MPHTSFGVLFKRGEMSVEDHARARRSFTSQNYDIFEGNLKNLMGIIIFIIEETSEERELSWISSQRISPEYFQMTFVTAEIVLHLKTKKSQNNSSESETGLSKNRDQK